METKKSRVRVDFKNGIAKFTKTSVVKALNILRQDDSINPSCLDSRFADEVTSKLHCTYKSSQDGISILCHLGDVIDNLEFNPENRVTYPVLYEGANLEDTIPQYLAVLIKVSGLVSFTKVEDSDEVDPFV